MAAGRPVPAGGRRLPPSRVPDSTAPRPSHCPLQTTALPRCGRSAATPASARCRSRATTCGTRAPAPSWRSPAVSAAAAAACLAAAATSAVPCCLLPCWAHMRGHASQPRQPCQPSTPAPLLSLPIHRSVPTPAGRYDVVKMFGFTVVWQSYAAGSGGGDALKLAFDTREQAEQWHAALAGAVERQALRKPRRARVCARAHVGMGPAPLPACPAGAAHQPPRCRCRPPTSSCHPSPGAAAPTPTCRTCLGWAACGRRRPRGRPWRGAAAPRSVSRLGCFCLPAYLLLLLLQR